MMTPEEARERITAVRAQLDDLVRAVSVPDVDWLGAFWRAQYVSGSLDDLKIRLLSNGPHGTKENEEGACRQR